MRTSTKTRIRLPIVLPAIGVALILFLGLFFHFRQLEFKHIEAQSRLNVERFLEGFQEHLKFDAKMLGGLLDFLEMDPEFQKTFLARNREELLRLTQPVFDNIRSHYQVTHFYFIQPDSKCFLRVHDPLRFNDTIGRFTLEQARKTGQPAFGIELGPLGTFTLRRVHPWKINGKVIGYLELGEEIEHISPHLARMFNTDLVFAIKKQFLNQKNWEEGLVALDKTGNWDQFSSFVVTQPNGLIHNLEEINQAFENGSVSFRVKDEDRFLDVARAPLLDVQGQHVGNVFVFSDVTHEYDFLTAIWQGSLLVIFILGSILFLLYNRYVRGLEIDLRNLYAELNTEIQERKKIADKLQKISLQYQLILNSAGEGIFGLDVKGNTIFINASGAKMLGYSVDEMVGKHMHSLVHHKKLDGSPCPWEECDTNRILHQGIFYASPENYFWKKDGTAIPIEYLVHPILENGLITGSVMVFRDISERKIKEAQLESTRKQLNESEKFASIGRLAEGVAHEVLNPLNIISMHIQMMLKKTADEIELQKPISKMKNEINRIEKIVNSLLSFSCKGEVTPQSCSINQLLEDVINHIKNDLANDNIEIKKEFDPELPDQSISPEEIRQVFLNLIKNAYDAMPEKGLLTLKTQYLKENPNKRIRIQVSDTGTGIRKENVNKIFEPFFTTKEEMYGAGMGLAVCQMLVEKYEGTIQATSEEGKGTTFTIEFPTS